MKTYVDNYFSRGFFKHQDLQKIGVYYNVPIKNIKEDKINEFEYDEDTDYILLDANSLDEYLDSYDDVSYEYTDEDECFGVSYDLMNYKKYNHFLVVAFNSTWNGASGYKLCDNYIDCFYRSYDCCMYVVGSSKSGKYLELRESHHDVPCGHTTIIIGLTDKEYEKIENESVENVIDYGKDCLNNKIIRLED